MKPYMFLSLVFLAAGCTTLGNLNKMNRVLPQIEQMVLRKDQTKVNEPQSLVLCGKDAGERDFLLAAAKQMGWQEDPELPLLNKVAGLCRVMSYKAGQ